MSEKQLFLRDIFNKTMKLQKKYMKMYLSRPVYSNLVYYRGNSTRSGLVQWLSDNALITGESYIAFVFPPGEDPSFVNTVGDVQFLATNKAAWQMTQTITPGSLTKIMDCQNIFADRANCVSTFEDDNSTLILGMDNGIRYRLQNRDLLGETDKRIRCVKDDYLSDTVTSEDIVAEDETNEDYPAGTEAVNPTADTDRFLLTSMSYHSGGVVEPCILKGSVKFSSNNLGNGTYRPWATLPDASISTVGIKYFDVKQGQWHIVPIFEYWYELGTIALVSEGWVPGYVYPYDPAWIYVYEYAQTGDVRFCWNSGDHFQNYTKSTFPAGFAAIPQGDGSSELFNVYASVIFSNGTIEVKFDKDQTPPGTYVCQDGEFEILRFYLIWHTADPAPGETGSGFAYPVGPGAQLMYSWISTPYIGSDITGGHPNGWFTTPWRNILPETVFGQPLRFPDEDFYSAYELGHQYRVKATAHYWDGTVSETADTACKTNNYTSATAHGFGLEIINPLQTILLDSTGGWDCLISWTLASYAYPGADPVIRGYRNWHSYNGGAIEAIEYPDLALQQDEGNFIYDNLVSNSPFGSTRQTVFYKDKDEIGVTEPFISEGKYEWADAETFDNFSEFDETDHEYVSNDTYKYIIDAIDPLAGTISYKLFDNRYNETPLEVDLPLPLVGEDYVYASGRDYFADWSKFDEAEIPGWHTDYANYHVITDNNILYCILTNTSNGGGGVEEG
jgi:hypothetical protein